jgi:undecaprenyl-diphosphatase
LTVGLAFIIGGIILILLDRRIQQSRHQAEAQWTWKQYLLLGFFQCLAFIPGVSRSAATIIGGVLLGMKKEQAAEFSFLLAVPTIAGASLVKIVDLHHEIGPDHFPLLVLGNVVSFTVALLAIKGFIGILKSKGFSYFGYYRIALGILVLVLYYKLGFSTLGN